jgi:4-hydroxybenzoate polyprenyltransferase
VSVEKAAVFFAAQMTAAFGLLCLLNPTTFWLGFMAPIPIMLYPLAKRSSIPEKFKHSALSYAFKPQV